MRVFYAKLLHYLPILIVLLAVDMGSLLLNTGDAILENLFISIIGNLLHGHAKLWES